MRLTGTTTMPDWSSAAMPPQCAPPMFDGIARVPSRLGGVKMPSFLSPAIMCWHAARPSGVDAERLIGREACGLRGGVTAVNG